MSPTKSKRQSPRSPIILDPYGENLRTVKLARLTPKTLVGIGNIAHEVRWHLDFEDLTGEQEASLNNLATATAIAWPKLPDNRPASYPSERALHAPNSLAEKLGKLTKHRAVRDAAEAVIESGITIFGASRKLWDHFDTSSEISIIEYHWLSRVFAIFVATSGKIENMTVRIDVDNEPPVIAPPGDFPYFVDGVEIRVASSRR